MADKARCAEMMWDKTTWSSYNCQRPAGYGAGAAYCKQHAKRHPSVDKVAAGMVKYWAEWEFSMPGLAQVTVIDETERTFTITNKTDLVGRTYIDGTNKKGSGLLTDNLEAACEWIEQSMEIRLLAAENVLRRAKETAAEVQQKIEQVKASEVQR